MFLYIQKDWSPLSLQAFTLTYGSISKVCDFYDILNACVPMQR